LLSKWPIRNKLLIGLALLLVIVGALSWGGIYGLYAYRSLVRSLSRRVPELPKANRLIQSVSDLRVALSDDTPQLPGEALRDSPREHWSRTAFQAKLETVQDNFQRYRDQLELNPDRGGISDSYQERETVREIERALRRIKAAEQQGDWVLGGVNVGKLQVELDELQRLTSELPDYLYDNINDFTVEARDQYRTLLILSWATSISAGLLLALFVKLCYQWVFRPLRVLISGSRKVAAGQFNYRIALETNDEMAELAGAMNDMTQRFQAIRDDLDRQVQERTKQVVRSEQLASVGFLAAGVAHEINNPLASIAMCAESLESRVRTLLSDDNPDQRVIGNYLRMIQNEAFRCKEITERLLDFSRIGDVKRQPADLGELVQGVIEMIGHLGKYQEKHVEFTVRDPVIVACNPQELKQVVLNLLVNGLDALDQGGTVKVELRRTASEAELLVTDNGCGMTDEVMKHLFEPFFTRRRGGQGTGLGLSIVYRIVADHEGAIEVHSEGPNRGSQFRVRLPLAARQQRARNDVEAASWPLKGTRQGCRVYNEGEATSLPSRINV